MTVRNSQPDVLDRLRRWAEARADIRAAILTSSRTRPDFQPDAFSDYDIIYVAEDIKPYLEDDGWLGDFGRVLVVYRDPVQTEYGFERFIRVTQYEDGLKIDFTLWPVGLLQHVAGRDELPDYIDDGYRVLLDKDGLTRGLKAPSCRAFVPKPPTEAEYLQYVEEFLSNTPYAAKHIRRGDIFALKFVLDFMRGEKLGKMLWWQAETEHGWSLKSGLYGKGLQKYLSPQIIGEIEGTCAGFQSTENWAALFELIKIFGAAARVVGAKMGYTYPADMEKRVTAYLKKVKSGELP